MTNIETKKELNNEFKDLKFILTSGMRTKLLLAIYERSKNLEELRTELKKPSATILHGLKDLEIKNLVKKVRKYYELTSNGYLLTTNMIKLIENWHAISKNEYFWNNHNLEDINEFELKNMYLLKDTEFIKATTSDFAMVFNKYIQLISNATELHMLLPIYSENHLKHIIDLLDSKKLEYVEIIASQTILKSIEQNEYFRENLIESKKVNMISTEKNLRIFLTYSKEFMALTLFFEDGHYDDSQMLIGKDKNALKWAQIIYSKYI